MSRRRELLLNLLLSLASIVVCLLAAEVVLRFLPVSTGLRSVPVTAADPILHFTPNRPFVNSLGATGVQEAIYSLLMMNNGFLCESAHIQELDPAFADMPIVRERKDNVKLGCVLSNSFGFGGTNASLVLKHVDA
jgi:stage V sporulation protein SpoVS